MDSVALDIDSHQIWVTRRSTFHSGYPSKVRFSSFSSVIPGSLSNQLWLGLVALILILPWGCGVEGITFCFNGFNGVESSNLDKVLAWSFSTDGPAPEIWIAQDAPPPPSSPPALSPSRMCELTSLDFSDARNPASIATLPVLSPAAPSPTVVNSPPPNNFPSPSPPAANIRAPSCAPGPPPSVSFLPPDPNTVTITISLYRSVKITSLCQSIDFTSTISPPSLAHKSNAAIVSGAVSDAVIGGVVFLLCCWKLYRIFANPIHFYIAHSSGEDGTFKNFAESLSTDMKSTWRYKFHIIRVYFDKTSFSTGENFTDELKQAMQEARVGVVIVTDDFFRRKWPMTELISFKDSKDRNPQKVRILPLFYKLNVKEVKDRLTEGTWDEEWANMSDSAENHPLDFQECKKAVKVLSQHHGIEYGYTTQGREAEYRKTILKKVGKMCNQMVLWS